MSPLTFSLSADDVRTVLEWARELRERRDRETTALVAVRALRESILDTFGDWEDCDDCADLERPCRIHDGGALGRSLSDAVCRAEDVIGPCACGHGRIAHDPDDARPCRTCRCRQFALPDPPAVAPAPKEDTR